MMNDKAQMMVLESVLFAIIILVALVFLYQLSPTSTVSNTYTNDLKIKGDDALRTLYNDEVEKEDLHEDFPQGFPKNKLVYYLITDDYYHFIISNLHSMLPPSTMYNIYISNGTKTIFWCNSNLDNSTPLTLIEPVTISHYVIAIHPDLLNQTKFPDIIDKDGCELPKLFENKYDGSMYDVILEICYIGGP